MAGFAKVEEMAVWRHARAFVSEVYAATRSAPFCRDFGLRDQIQRATVSIGSNIAEGFERQGNKEFVRFLWIAKGSAAEVATQLYFAKDLGYINEKQFMALFTHSKQISGMIYNLIDSIKVSEK